MIMKKTILLLATLLTTSVWAQSDRSIGTIKSALIGLEYQMKFGISLGGTTPMPLPVEIRKIKGYDPTLCMAIVGNVTNWIDANCRWGARVGIRLETKGMETDASVKNYGMEIRGNGGELLKGNWTGCVKTTVNNRYITMPITAVYKTSGRFAISIGPYFSYLMRGSFLGHVYDGYLREGNPTGEKVVFEGDKTASYDFTHNLRRFQWGAQGGCEWRALKHLNLYADLTWGINDIFKKDFTTITFAMRPIYINVGAAYLF